MRSTSNKSLFSHFHLRLVGLGGLALFSFFTASAAAASKQREFYCGACPCVLLCGHMPDAIGIAPQLHPVSTSCNLIRGDTLDNYLLTRAVHSRAHISVVRRRTTRDDTPHDTQVPGVCPANKAQPPTHPPQPRKKTPPVPGCHNHPAVSGRL